ncbi:MAG: GNAT family N-acetyltransferase [Candidatus Kapabacteria bacterium]|nr:GNAT family N-acetyltransferase [Candidatus Kapabacteria bacterium]
MMFTFGTLLDDASKLNEIMVTHLRSMQETYGDIDPRLVGDQQSVALYWQKVTAKRHRLLTMIVDEQVVGFILATPSRLSEGNIWEIRALYILASHQRHGIGRQLLASLRGVLAEDGVEVLDILVHCKNVKARTFFIASGAKPTQCISMSDSALGHVDTVLLRLPVDA